MHPRTRRTPAGLGLICLLSVAVQQAAAADMGRGSQTATALPDSGAIYRVPEIEVRARRLDRQELLDSAPAFGSVLSASSWAGGVTTAATALAGAAGVNVRESGGIGSYSTVSLRGSSAGQVPIYLDGVPLNAPQRGEVNLADLPLAGLERIEVYRGAAPLILGGASLGGAIHLFSGSTAVPPWLCAARSSFGTAELQGGAGARLRGWTVALRGRLVRSRGDWRFPTDNGTPYNQEDDGIATRANNDVGGAGGLLSARRPLRGWTLVASELLDGREQGVPGYAISPAQHARSSSFTHQLRVALERPRSLGGAARGLRSVELYHRLDRQGFFDHAGELGLGPADRKDCTASLGAAAIGRLAGWLQRWPALQPAWRLETQWSRLRSEDGLAADPRGAPQTRWTLAAAVQPALHLLHDRLELVPGARVEMDADRFHGVPFGTSLPGGPADRRTSWAHTWQLGARYALGGGVELKTNLGAYDRVPTLLERFGARGTVIGNPGLQPEHGVNRDLGFVWSGAGQAAPWARQRIAVSVFHNDARDLIAFVRNSQRTAVPLNIGAAEIQGLEVEAELGVPGVVTWQANYTRLLTRDRTNTRYAAGKQLPGRPGHEAAVRIGFGAAGRSAPGAPPVFGYTIAALAEDYLDRANRDRVPSRVLQGVFANLALHWPARAALLSARVDNLTNEQVFDLAGWPLPGRTLTVSLSVGGRGSPVPSATIEQDNPPSAGGRDAQPTPDEVHAEQNDRQAAGPDPDAARQASQAARYDGR
jgi:outer membrane cobalamin receptor